MPIAPSKNFVVVRAYVRAVLSRATVARRARADEGDNAIVAITPGERTRPFRLVSDPDFGPLDLAIAPNGNVVVSSEHPFGASDAVTSVREYDTTDGHLVRAFSPTKSAEFRKPRGLRFGPDGHLYCVAQDAVVAFDFTKGACLGTTVQFQRLNGQALAFFA